MGKYTKMRSFFLAVITLAWVGSLIAGWLDHSYSPPFTVHLMMGAAASFLLGDQALAFLYRRTPGAGEKDSNDGNHPSQ